MSSWLHLLKPVIRLVPQVEGPPKKPALQHRIAWTAICLLIFLMMCQIPLYGVRVSENADPMYWLRVMMASNRGTLMELGISPIVTSGMVLQLLQGAKIIAVDMQDRAERELYEGFNKAVGLGITLMQATMYVYSGMYGSPSQMGTGNCVAIIAQLFTAGVLVLLLDDLLKNYGMGSGINIFIATNICEQIIWKSFSPTTFNTGRGPEFEGALIATFHKLITRQDKMVALREAFYRTNLPNLTNLMSTIVVFLIVIYVQGFKVELPIRSNRQRGTTGGTFPIKLFYTSNIPVILQTAVVSHMFFFSKMLYARYGSNLIVQFFGTWVGNKATGGLAYYLTPPDGFGAILVEPLHFGLYVLFVLGTCAGFSVLWLEISNQSSTHVAKQLEAQGLVISGFRSQGVVKVLDRYIPIAAAFGGICIGTLSIFADLMGAIGSGTGILLAVSIIFNYWETYSRETSGDSSKALSFTSGNQNLFNM